MNVSVDVEGLEEAKARFTALRDRTLKLQPALLRSGIVVLKAAQDRIDAGGPGWPPNKSGTPLLHQTGRLLASLTVGAAGNVDNLTDTEIEVGTNVRYASWLQGGTGIFGPKGSPITPNTAHALSFNLGGRRVTVKSIKGTPKRPFLFIDAQSAENVRDIFAKYILGDPTVTT